MRKYILFPFFLFIFFSGTTYAFDQININFKPAPNTPYFIGVPEFNIDAEEFPTVVLNIKSNHSGMARLFWANNIDPQMNEPKSIPFFIDRSDDYKAYVFNAKSQNPYWSGFVSQLLIFPDGGSAGIEIGPSDASISKFTTNIQSGWREFWGPRGRLVIGSTINTMASVVLFGQPITAYLYWLIVMTGLGYTGYLTNKWFSSKKKEPFDLLWQKIGQGVILAILLCWCFLEASNMFSLWLVAKQDAVFIGKKLEEKRILANTGDFYKFMLFCQKNIPLKSRIDTRIPPMYNDIKATYYLYPRKVTSEAEYLVVYDLKPDANSLNKFAPWQTFRPGAMILKRGKS